LWLIGDLPVRRHLHYSMSSSARASTDGGIVRPSAFAVFDCRCDRPEQCTVRVPPDPRLLAKLDILRDRFASPIIVDSGGRCAYWNAHEHGEPTSGHLVAPRIRSGTIAADLACLTGQARWRFLAMSPANIVNPSWRIQRRTRPATVREGAPWARQASDWLCR
jgi:hypothetical protein